MSKRPFLLHLCTWMLVGGHLLTALADGPADNQPDKVRRVPKIGVDVPDADRQELEQGLKSLSEQIEQLKIGDATAQKLLPDVLIFHRAVDQALRYREFFDVKEIPVAKILLKQGQQRAEELLAGKAPWTQQKGLVVRGYISKIDKTVQPIGLVIPPEYDFAAPKPHRLDFWFHGRGENLSELNFLNDRIKNVGAINPSDTIVLHPYGRYCNANKFAGEVDSFEALESVQQQYRIDPDRISVRGFSMGGAAVWQFAVHYPDRWFAANPGAGFAETPDFLKVFQKETLKPAWYEQKLWEMYDCPGYAANLAHLPTIAYSGEIDSQKQAADIMAAAFEREGMKLLHIIGPKTAHSIHPESKKEIEAKLAEWAVKGIDHAPASLQFVTFTLSYNRMHWLTVDGLKEHWEEARVTAKLAGTELDVKTKNVSALTLQPPKGSPRKVRLDGGAAIELPADGSAGSFVLGASGWQAGQLKGLHKQHGLQGPIDDAFLDSFVFVKPTGKASSEAVDKWVQSEFEHAVTHWRQQMRGDAVVKSDTDITEQDIASSNLVLWGDAQSNKVLAKIADKLPIRWTEKSVVAGDQSFDGANHALIATYPNPLNPKKYIVLNSSFTYREYDYLNNARQTAKLPDWVIVDVRTPPNSRFPGKIVAADFFDEGWQLKPAKTK
ncbi:MAG: prolyl oligopeptidase family protein [Schlesneria sp.]|nr:prolyl oligopeptidase family protein [Schlesneria sp.]